MTLRSDPALQMVSIATKAGKVKSGEFAVEKSIKEGTAFLVLVAGDASENTKKNFTEMCNYRDIPCIIYKDSEALGGSCGKPFRMSVAICDRGLAETINDKISGAI